MGLNKVTYVDEETVIEAQNLNDIQDAILDAEESLTRATTTEIQNYVIGGASS